MNLNPFNKPPLNNLFNKKENAPVQNLEASEESLTLSQEAEARLDSAWSALKKSLMVTVGTIVLMGGISENAQAEVHLTEKKEEFLKSAENFRQKNIDNEQAVFDYVKALPAKDSTVVDGVMTYSKTVKFGDQIVRVRYEGDKPVAFSSKKVTGDKEVIVYDGLSRVNKDGKVTKEELDGRVDSVEYRTIVGFNETTKKVEKKVEKAYGFQEVNNGKIIVTGMTSHTEGEAGQVFVDSQKVLTETLEAAAAKTKETTQVN